jgi:hypothetical protein
MSPESIASPRKPGWFTKSSVFSILALLIVVLAACGQGTASQSKTQNSVLNIIPSPKGDFTDGFSPYSSAPNSSTMSAKMQKL